MDQGVGEHRPGASDTDDPVHTRGVVEATRSGALPTRARIPRDWLHGVTVVLGTPTPAPVASMATITTVRAR